MITKQLLLSKLNPYMLYIKLSFIVVLFLSGVFVGCKMDEPDCSAQEKARSELIVENATLRAANADYAKVEQDRNRLAAAQAAAQKEQEAKAQAEVRAAQARTETLQKRIDEIEARNRKAKVDPKCKDIMAMEVVCSV